MVSRKSIKGWAGCFIIMLMRKTTNNKPVTIQPNIFAYIRKVLIIFLVRSIVERIYG